nr:hypothetical protein HUO10_002403 [Paraburkholderia busanensis]
MRGRGHDSTAGLSRDTANANGSVQNTFDARKVGDDMAVQQGAVQVGMQVAGDIAGALQDSARKKMDDANGRLKAAQESGDTAAEQQARADLQAAQSQYALWGNEGAGRIGAHAIVAGVGAALGGGNVLGAAGGTIAGDIASNAVTGALPDTLGTSILSNIAAGAAGATLGGALGGTGGAMSGANGALGADLYNRQLHPDEKKKLADLQQGKSPEEQQRLADAACYLVQCASQMSDMNPDKAGEMASQQRGAGYTSEQNDLKHAGGFVYTLTDLASDDWLRSGDRGVQEIKSAARGAVNLANGVLDKIIANGGQGAPADADPLTTAMNGGKPPSGSAGAVVTPPMMACPPSAACIITPPIVSPGSAGYVPSNATISSGNGDNEAGGNGSGDVNLASPDRTSHILTGDSTGGGHQWPGGPGKSVFPENWSASKIMNTVSDIATDPSIPETVQASGRIVKNGSRDGIDIRVVIEPASKGGGIVTAFPTNVPRNPK